MGVAGLAEDVLYLRHSVDRNTRGGEISTWHHLATPTSLGLKG